MQVGERVSVGGSRTGTLRFAGTVKFAPGYVIALSCCTLYLMYNVYTCNNYMCMMSSCCYVNMCLFIMMSSHS